MKSNKNPDNTHSREELEKEKKDIEKKLKTYDKVPDYGDDVDSFEEETEEAEEYSKNLGVQQVLKERLEEIESLLRNMNKKKKTAK